MKKNDCDKTCIADVVTLYVAEMSCVEDQPKSQSPPGWLIGVGFLLGVVAGHPKVRTFGCQ